MGPFFQSPDLVVASIKSNRAAAAPLTLQLSISTICAPAGHSPLDAGEQPAAAVVAHPLDDGADQHVALWRGRLVQHPALAVAAAGDPHEPGRERAERLGQRFAAGRQRVVAVAAVRAKAAPSLCCVQLSGLMRLLGSLAHLARLMGFERSGCQLNRCEGVPTSASAIAIKQRASAIGHAPDTADQRDFDN